MNGGVAGSGWPVGKEQPGRKHTPLPSAFGQIVGEECCYFAVGGRAAFMPCQPLLCNGTQAGQGVAAIRLSICCARAAVCGCEEIHPGTLALSLSSSF